MSVSSLFLEGKLGKEKKIHSYVEENHSPKLE